MTDGYRLHTAPSDAMRLSVLLLSAQRVRITVAPFRYTVTSSFFDVVFLAGCSTDYDKMTPKTTTKLQERKVNIKKRNCFSHRSFKCRVTIAQQCTKPHKNYLVTAQNSHSVATIQCWTTLITVRPPIQAASHEPGAGSIAAIPWRNTTFAVRECIHVGVATLGKPSGWRNALGRLLYDSDSKMPEY